MRIPILCLGLALGLPASGLADNLDEARATTRARQAALSPDDVLARLLAGNERFAAGTTLRRNLRQQVAETAAGQHPLATVLTCIDSRVPPELIFDQGIGDLFVARVAGNFVDEEILGSLEFASQVAGAKLLVVLGHSQCGAIQGACDGVRMGNLTATLAQLQGAVEAVRARGDFASASSSDAAFVAAVTHQNVRDTLAEIRAESAILRELEAERRLRIVGASYDVATGRVVLLD